MFTQTWTVELEDGGHIITASAFVLSFLLITFLSVSFDGALITRKLVIWRSGELHTFTYNNTCANHAALS
jgi:hypothetical protein